MQENNQERIRASSSYRRCIADGRIAPIGALRDIDGLTDVVAVHISPRNILHISRPSTTIITVAARERGDSRPRLDPGSARCIVKDNVLEQYILDIVRFCGVLSDGADWHTPRTVACHIANVEIRGVALDRDTVVA